MSDNQRKPRGKPTRITDKIGAYIVKLRDEEDLSNLQIANRIKAEYDGITIHRNIIGRYLKEKNKSRKKTAPKSKKFNPALPLFMDTHYGPDGEKPSLRQAQKLFKKETGTTAPIRQFKREMERLGIEILKWTGRKLGQKNKKTKKAKEIRAAVIILCANKWHNERIANKIQKQKNTKRSKMFIYKMAKEEAKAISKHFATYRKIGSILSRHRRISRLRNEIRTSDYKL